MFVVLMIFASGAVAFYTVFFRPEGEVVIPPLKGRSVVEAVAEAERMGFAVQIEQVASTLPEGRVLAQDPEPGSRARKRQVVVLHVSKSGDLHAVPDVRGQGLARAQAIIKEQGFMLGDVIRIRDAGQPGGAVIAQSPAAPANISVSRKIDLLINEGGGGDVTIPDVNRMTEQEARALIEASGLKVQTVDRVYSPVMPEGLAIETRPGAGTTVKAGEGVRLKIATTRRPAGYTEPTSEPQRDVRRATIPATSQDRPTQAQRPQGALTINVPGQGDVFIGDPSTPADAPVVAADPNLSVFDQERPAPRPQPQPAPVTPPQPTAPTSNKTARIRYQVPPLSSPLPLRIQVTDPAGTRTVLERQARSGESISVEAPYRQECVVSVYLGGDLVWQEKRQ